MIVKLLVLLCALFFAPQIVAEEGGVCGDTLIACASGLLPVNLVIKGSDVWTMSEKGRTISKTSKVKSYKENTLLSVIIEGINKRGIKKRVAIVGAPGQRIYCPNRQEWVKFCELDKKEDLVCINFCEPVPIVNIKEYPLYWYNQTELVYHFEVATYGMFFASELYVPLHNCPILLVPLGAYVLGFSVEFLLACASSLVLTVAVNELDKVRGIKRHDEIDDNVKDLLKKLNKAQADKLAAANAPETVGEAASSQAVGNCDGASRDQAAGCANQPPQETPPSDQGSNQDSNQDSGQGPNNQDPEDPNNGEKKALAAAAGGLAAKKLQDQAKKAVVKVAESGGKVAGKTAGNVSKVANKTSKAAGNASKAAGNVSKAGNAAAVKPAPNPTPKATTPTQSTIKPATQQATPKQATQPGQNATQASAKQGATQQQTQPAAQQTQFAQNATQQQAQTQQPANATPAQDQNASKRGVSPKEKYRTDDEVAWDKAIQEKTKVADRDASSPVGRRGQLENNLRNTENAPATIQGQEYSGHAVDRMQGRGIPPSAVKNAVETGICTEGKRPGTFDYYDKVNDLTVVADQVTGNIVTVTYGKL